MKIAIATDIHAGARNNSKFFLNHLISFFNDVFFPYIDKNGIKDVFLLGDLFDNRRAVDIFVITTIMKNVFDEFKNRGVNVVTLVGNHDVYYKNTNEINTIELIAKAYPNVRVIHKPKVLTFDSMRFAFISWIPEQEMEQAARWISEQNADVLLGHFELRNFEHICGHEFENGVDYELFERYEMVLSGHYHRRSNDGKFFYLGNPSQLNWGEYEDKKGFHVLDTDTRHLEFVENPLTVFEKIEYTDNIDIMAFDYSQFTNKIVMVLVDDIGKIKRKKYALFLETLDQYAFMVDTVESGAGITSEDEYHLGKIVDTQELISSYIETILHGSDGYNSKKIEKYTMNLYTNALKERAAL